MKRRYKLTMWAPGTYWWQAEHTFRTRWGARRFVKQFRDFHGEDAFDYTLTDTWTGRHEHA